MLWRVRIDDDHLGDLSAVLYTVTSLGGEGSGVQCVVEVVVVKGDAGPVDRSHVRST